MFCKAINHKGQKCQNKALDTSGFCQYHHNDSSLHPTDGKYFEEEVLKILRVLGYTVERNVHIGGCQVDIYGEYRTGVISLKLMVECKDYSNDKSVGIEDLNKFFAVFTIARNCGIVDKGLFVTTNGFTPQAKTFACTAGIELTTYSDLSTQLVNLDGYIDQIIQDYERTPVSKFYIDLSGTEEEEYEGNEDVKIYRPIDTFVDRCLFKDKQSKLALLGNFGTGKSTFCRKYAYDLAKKYKKDNTNRIPVIISLKGYDSRFHIQQLVLDTLQYRYGVNLTSPVSLALQRIGKFIFLFDGLDEMDAKANLDMVRANLRELRTISEIKENKFIVTCRTHFFRNKVQAEVLSDFNLAFIPEWGEIELKEYLEKRFGDNWNNHIARIYGTHNLLELARTPLFLDMIAEALPKLGDFVKRIELYQTYTEFWIKDQSNRRNALLNANERRIFVKELAVKLFTGNLTSCHFSEFNGIVRHCLNRVQSEGDMRFEGIDAVQLDYLCSDVQTCTFLIRDAAGNFSFRHNSFMEFFVAQVLNEDIKKGAFSHLEGSILPIEIRGFLIEFLNEDTPVDILKNGLEIAQGEILRDNLLAIISQLNINISIPESSTEVEQETTSKTIIGFLRGDTKAFEALFYDYYHLLTYSLIRKGATNQQAEDIVIRVFFNVWLKRDAIESIYHFKAYLLRSAQNAFIDYQRSKSKNQIERNISSDDNNIEYVQENEWEKIELISTLSEAIERLPRLQCLIIKGYMDNKKAAQIAMEQKITITRVYKLKNSALKKLRIYLKEKGYNKALL
jgi:RNA polymerase sigma factor (sigma-70 family)